MATKSHKSHRLKRVRPRMEVCDASRALLILASDVHTRVTIADAADPTRSIEASVIRELIQSRYNPRRGDMDTCVVLVTVQQAGEAVATVLLHGAALRKWALDVLAALNQYDE